MLKCQRTVEKTYSENTEQQTRYGWRFYKLKWLRKDKNNVSGLSQQTRNVQCMYLAFKNLKITFKKYQKSSER